MALTPDQIRRLAEALAKKLGTSDWEALKRTIDGDRVLREALANDYYVSSNVCGECGRPL